MAQGKKAGGGNPRKPRVAPDSAASISYVNIVYGLANGEIAGLANGYNSIRLDGTPIVNSLGEPNLEDVEVEFRTGTNDQLPLAGFKNVVNEIGYNNIEVTDQNSFIHHISDTQFTTARVRLTFGAIYHTNSTNGDVSGYQIDYAIDVQVDGLGFVQYGLYTIKDKTSANYERSHLITLPEADQSWDIRVRRLTPNRNSQYYGDKMYVSAVAEIINAQFNYPNTAVLGLKYDASRFSNIAKLAVRLKGRIIRIPENLDPETGIYATTGAGTTNGTWNGSFKWAYSTNPAWIYYDLLLSTMYGLGDSIDATMIDKWSLYVIGKYCDQQVPDGFGGTEKRLEVNVYISSYFEAYDLLMQLSGVFRGIQYWDGERISVDMDRPREPVYTYHPSNVIGSFSYSGSREKDRYSVVVVEYDDPDLDYKTVPMTVFNRQAMRELGVKVKKIQAFGCTSRGQAQRAGYWALYKNLYETRVVTFKVGLDGFIAPVGKIIEIADPKLAGRANGGRIAAVSMDKTQVTLDRVVGAVGDRLVINGDDGVSESRDIIAVNQKVVTVSMPFENVSPENTFGIESEDLKLMRFTVVSVTQDTGENASSFSISAVQHEPAIFDAAENDVFIEPRPATNINPNIIDPVTGLEILETTKVVQGISVTDLVITWKQVSGAVRYDVQWRKDDGQWVNVFNHYSNTLIIENVFSGVYQARVVAINAADIRSRPTVSQPISVVARYVEPPALAFFQAEGILLGIRLKLGYAPQSENGLFVEVQVATLNDYSDAQLLTNIPYPNNQYEYNGLQPNATFHYRARLVDKNQFKGPWSAWVTATVNADPDKLIDIISGHLTEQTLDQALRGKLNAVVEGVADATALAQQANTAATNAATKAQEAADAVTQEAIDRAAALQAGISQVTTDYTAADSVIYGELNAYKASNDSAVATAVQKAESAVAAGSTNSQAITELTGQVQTLNNTKLDASAISNYYTKGQADDKSAEIAAGQITAFEATLALGGGWMDIGREGAQQIVEAGAGTIEVIDRKLNHFKITATSGGLFSAYIGDCNNSSTIPVGTPYVMTVKVRASRANLYDSIYARVNQYSSESYVYGWNATSDWVTLITKGVTNTGNYSPTDNLIGANVPNAIAGDWVEFKDCRVSVNSDNITATNSQAIRTTETVVDIIDGKVEAQAADLLNLNTNLTNLNNSKLDASIIQQYRTAVDQDSVTAGELTQFKSALKIGGDNLFTGTKTFNNQATENSTSSFYPSYGGFGGNTQEFLPNALFGTHTVVKSSSSWCGFYLREADGISWEAQEDMVLSFWANASSEVHVYGIASQLGLAATIPANQPMTKYEVLIPKGTPLRNAVNQGMIEFYFPYGGTLWYGAVMLQVGTKSTSWQPSSKESDTAVGSLATALTQTNTRVGNVENGIASQANQLTNLSAKLNERKMYQLYSGGLEATTGGMGWLRGFDPSSYYDIGRSYGLVVFNGDGSIQSVNSYDVYGGYTQGFIGAVAAVPAGTYVAVLTSDEPSNNKEVIKPALRSLGGSDAIDQVVGRGAYLLVGRKGLPTGQAIEKVSNTTSFGIDYVLEMFNGVPIGLGGTSPQSDIISNMRTEVTNIGGNITSLSETVTSHTASLSVVAQGTYSKTHVLDLRGLDENLYYPVVMSLATAPSSKLRILRTLGSFPERPSWSTHGQGFDCKLEWVATGDGWGTTSRDLTIIANDYRFAQAVPFLGLGQITESSLEYIHLRGGAQYYLDTSSSAGYPRIITSAETHHGRTLAPMPYSDSYIVSAPDLKLKASAEALTQTRAEVQEINGLVSSLSQQTTVLSTTVDQNTSKLVVQGNSIDGIKAEYFVKTDVNGLIAGYGLVNSGSTSAFGVNADTFYIGAPSNGKKPFIQRNEWSQINGVWVPPGTYIDTAYIGNATIGTSHINDLAVTNAKIANLAVDNAKIANLSVDTLKIQNNAVTVPVGVSNPNIVQTTGSFLPQNFDFTAQLTEWEARFPPLATITLNRQGGQCRFDASCNVAASYALTAYAQEDRALSENDRLMLRLVLSVYKGSVLVGRAEVPPTQVIGQSGFSFEGALNVVAIIDSDNTIGTTTYTLKLGFANRGSRGARIVLNHPSGVFGVNNIRFVALELKK